MMFFGGIWCYEFKMRKIYHGNIIWIMETSVTSWITDQVLRGEQAQIVRQILNHFPFNMVYHGLMVNTEGKQHF